MNSESTKLTKFLAASALGLTAILAGCTGPVAVTEENAPSDLLKKAAAITSESDPADVQEVFQGLVDATQKASDNRLIITEEASGTGLKLDSEDLETTENSFKNYDVRYGTEISFFQLYEEKSQDDAIYGLMDSSDKTITTVYMLPDEDDALGKDTAKMTISSIDTRESGLSDATPEQLASSIDNAIVYPLYTLLGSSLVIQPMASPENYDFKLEKNGSQYTWTISIADQELYNKTLDDTFEQAYGHDRKDIRGDGTFILDSYDITGVSMVLTMDSEGALSKIVSSNQSTVTKGDRTQNLSSQDTVSIEQAPTTWKAFFEGFFQEIADGRLKEEDSFALMQTFGNAVSSESSSADSASSAASQQKSTESKPDSSEAKSESDASLPSGAQKDSEKDEKAEEESSEKKEDSSKDASSSDKADSTEASR